MAELETLREELHRYAVRYPEEKGVTRRFLTLIEEGLHAFSRNRAMGHLTSSGWVLDPARRRVLLVHHRKLDKWLQPGGHADGETDLLLVAQKEVFEETGVETVPLKGSEIFDLDIHPIPARGEVAVHEHFDARFLLLAREETEPAGNEETHEAKWVDLMELEGLSEERSILRLRDKLVYCPQLCGKIEPKASLRKELGLRDSQK